MLERRAFGLLDVVWCSAVLISAGGACAGLIGSDGPPPLMNNSGELAKALMLYATDHEGSFPLTMSRRPEGSYRWATMHPAPADAIATSGWNTPAIVQATSVHWANSVRPYVKDPSHYRDSTQSVRTLPGDTFRDGVQPLVVGLSMNGLLHSYSQSAVTAPGLVPLVWAGNGSIALKGRATTTPLLYCTGRGPCKFDPSGNAQPDSPGVHTQGVLISPITTFPNETVWSLRTGENSGGGTIAFVDGSSKFMQWGTKMDPDFHTSAAVDMYAAVYTEAELGTQGFFFWSTSKPDCTDVSDEATSGNNTYPCFFRPDRVK